MSFWAQIKFDYSSNENVGYSQEIKTNHYYREVEHGVLHVNINNCINMIDSLPSEYVCRRIDQEEFEEKLKETINHLGINLTNHKFI